MPDYRKSLEAGFKAHAVAEQATKEIFEVFDDFARQVHEASNQLVRVEREERTERTPSYSIEQLIQKPLMAFDPSAHHERHYEAIVAMAQNDSEELCEYALGELGYPVRLLYARKSVRCHDRAALESGLQDLLEHPETAGRLRRLMGNERAA